MTSPASFRMLPRELRQTIWFQAVTVQVKLVVHYVRVKPDRQLPFWMFPVWHETDTVSYVVRLPRNIVHVCREAYDTLSYHFRPYTEPTTLPAWFDFELDDVSTNFMTILHAWRQPWAAELQRLTYHVEHPVDAFGDSTYNGPIRPPAIQNFFSSLRLVTIDVQPCENNFARYTNRAHASFVWKDDKIRHWTDSWMVPMLNFHDGELGQFAIFDLRVICTNAPKEEWLTRWNYLRVRRQVLVKKAIEARSWFRTQDLQMLLRLGHLDDSLELDNPPVWLSRHAARRDPRYFVV